MSLVNSENLQEIEEEPQDLTEERSDVSVISSVKEYEEASNDKEEENPETDLEIEEERRHDFDVTGRSLYLSVCKTLGVVPASYFIRHMQDEILNLQHHGLGCMGVKAMSYPLQNNTTILTLNLSDNWLEGEGGEYIAEMLKENCYIADLNLSENRLGSKGAMAICSILSYNTTVKYLNLSGNDLCDQDAQYVAEALLENNTLKKLNLSHNAFADLSGKILGHAIGENETLEEIDLSWNYFRRNSLMELCDGISGNCRLRYVNLSMNGFDNQGAFGVADIIKKNNMLLTLDISHNRIGTTGAIVIGKALEVNDVLKCFKFAHNPIGSDGAKAVLLGVSHENNIINDLDLSGIEVDKDFKEMEKNFPRQINISRGPVLSDFFIPLRRKPDNYLFGTPMSLVCPETLLTSLKKYCEENNYNILESLHSVDKDKSGSVCVADFFVALEMAGIPLSEKQGDKLTKTLESLAEDEIISYSALKTK